MKNNFLAVDKSYFNKGLKSIDILIIAQIEEYERNNCECYVTNEQFAEMFGDSRETIKRSLTKLESMGIIRRKTSYVEGNGRANRQRVLSIKKSKCKAQNEPTNNQMEGSENTMVGSNIDNGMEVMNMDEMTNNTVETVETEETTETKTYTQEEVMALLQSETDKRVSQALKTQQKKYEKQLSLSKLDGSEREKAEKDNRIAELEEQLAQFQIERNKSELKSVLSARGLSAEFADIIAINDDIEASQAKIDALDKLFKAAVRAEVEKRLAGNAPKGNGGGNPAEITKEQAKKMSLSQMMELKEKNPEQYNKLFN